MFPDRAMRIASAAFQQLQTLGSAKTNHFTVKIEENCFCRSYAHESKKAALFRTAFLDYDLQSCCKIYSFVSVTLY